MTTAIIGTGNIGGQVARHLVAGGEQVVLAAHHESHAAALAKELGPLASATSVRQATASRDGRVGLHDEIIAVIRERGPSTAAELATAIRERGRYLPPRSAKPLDAATVNSRVSNPVYRGRFRRAEGRISLAE